MTVASRLLRLADRAGATEALLELRRRVPPHWLTIATWHRVDAPREAEDVDEDVLDATPARFKQQVDLLARHFNVLDLDGLRRRLVDNAPFPPNPALITFDDGYRDNWEHALPILLGAGVPAAFFVTTDPITRRVPFWWDAGAWIVKHARRTFGELAYPVPFVIDLETTGVRATIERVLRVVKDTFALDVARFLDGLAAALDAPWDASVREALADRLLMTWDQVRALRDAGMDVGSHTRTHRVLDTVPEALLDDELSGSRDDLARELGLPPTAVAYPVGRPVLHIPAVRRAVIRAGYTMGFTYLTGFQPLDGPIDLLGLDRIAVDRSLTVTSFRARLASLGRV